MDKTLDESALGEQAFAFSAAVRKISTMNALAAMVLATVTPFGMTAVASGLVSGPKAASGNPFHFANWPSDWIELCIKEDFLLADPIPRWARNSGRPVQWSELIRLLPERDHGRRVIEAAAQFGFTEGLVVPTRSGDNSLGCVSIGGARPSFSITEQIFLTVVARAIFEAADRIENSSETGQAAPILTTREIDCLTLLVRGHHDSEIGGLLGLTTRTVRFHFSNAREKFQASSRAHLAAQAMAQGYLNI